LGALGLLLFPARLSAAENSNELGVGRALDRQRLTLHILVFDEQASRRVDEIGQALAKHTGRPEFAFTFRIVSDEVVNAFATAGGYLYINTGLLDFCESEAELAAVLAHELVHVSNAHLIKYHDDARQKAINAEVMKFLARMALAAAGAAAGSAAGLPSGPGGNQFQQFGNDLGLLIGAGIIDPATRTAVMGYGKELELEADQKAVTLMVQAGYDPNALVRFLEKLQGQRDRMIASREPLATALINAEPGLEERVKILKAAIATSQAQPPKEGPPKP
jgi:beta-barrel assembly-enhancing protease